jgi:hypothetical protein
MKEIIHDKFKLSKIIKNGISTEQLNKRYDYSSITDMSELLEHAGNLKYVPWMDTSNVTCMDYMFYMCESLIEIPNLDTSKCGQGGLINIFYGCFALEKINPHYFIGCNMKNIKNSTFSACLI